MGAGVGGGPGWQDPKSDISRKIKISRGWHV